MQFRTIDQAQLEPYRCQYRHSRLTVSIGTLIMMLGIVVSGHFVQASWIEKSTIGVLISGWIGFWAALFSFVLFGITRRRWLPSNWLVRTHPEGISIKFRSYLNYHFDPADAIVVHIDYSEIEYVRDHRVRQDVPGVSRDGTETRYMKFAEFKLRDEHAIQLIGEALVNERARKAPLGGRFIRHREKYDEYPVQVTDGLLRIQWSVFPRLPAFIADIAAFVPMKERIKTKEDFSDLRKSDARDREDALHRLISSGDTFDAIRLIRQLYGYDLTRAIQFLNDLSSPKPQ
jgi:hypothetical protein